MTSWVFPAATLERVVDGDTFLVNVSRSMDFGFHLTSTLTSTQRFRLNGCNTAPVATPSGAGARDRLTELLVGAFTLTSLGPYKFGDEWMADVILSDGRNVASIMLLEQWAAPWTGRGQQPLPPWPRTVP